ncbi:hypothetical protein SLEP1_g7939 [Rubroshorea leprosula]|uniref:Uncharacterized protein n=1 Tax=Rubroshorea leprosula TaxID=152421 RepID=A0AAV5I043_9ROSI|nr:hypothetical protein SLEP1_g7939 [Rubroshorea leprosula]
MAFGSSRRVCEQQPTAANRVSSSRAEGAEQIREQQRAEGFVKSKS